MAGRFSHPPAARLTRRAALQAGTLGLLGLGMGQLAALRAADAAARGGVPRTARARSVIYIFLSGGLSQLDSFDPKPEAPSEIRGEFGTIATRTPGLRICEHLPELAKRSESWALCRSLSHGSNDHSLGHHIMLTGHSEAPAGFDPNKPKSSDWPSLAALAQALLPVRNNLPPAIVLPEKLVHYSGRVIPGQFAGLLGRRGEPWVLDASPYNPTSYGAYPEFLFHHREGARKRDDLQFRSPNLSLPDWLGPHRLRGRLALLDDLDSQRALLENAAEVQSFDRYWQMAVSLLTQEKTVEAFDVTRADPRLLDRYGRNSFGWSLLMAARLVEAGVSLVQVNLGNDETWDTHESIFPNLRDYLFPPTDRAVSALLDDLRSRGLLDSTLIVMASEFGRTPKISMIDGARLPGRDHWGAVQTAWFAGAGVPGGAVIGASDNLGAYPAADTQRPENFAATIFEALGLPPTSSWHDEQGRPYPLCHAKPIPGLVA